MWVGAIISGVITLGSNGMTPVARNDAMIDDSFIASTNAAVQTSSHAVFPKVENGLSLIHWSQCHVVDARIH